MRAKRGSSTHVADRNLRGVDIANAGDASPVNIRGRAGENEPLGLTGGVEIVDVGGAETELDGARGVVLGSGMERELRLARVELAPEGGLEQRGQAQGVAIECDSRV